MVDKRAESTDEPFARYDVYSTDGLLIRPDLGSREAADLLAIDEDELEWAIEEFGLCESEGFLVKPTAELK